MPRRRLFFTIVFAALAGRAAAGFAQAKVSMRDAMTRALEMRRRAEAAGDQPYGAVVVKDGVIIAESPSRVVTAANVDAHAEREALRLAQERLGTRDLAGCLLVSSSRPCGLCEKAAFTARIGRMIHGESLTDAGPPRG